MKKIPYGISNYKTIAQENYVYVDKTNYIEKLENYHSPFIFFLRPRRFGKSLFTSILSYYYDICEKENFESIFGQTYIGKNATPKRNSFYVLSFDFSGVTTDTKEYLEESFMSVSRMAYKNFQNKYALTLNYSKEGTVANQLEEFLTEVIEKINAPIYVIIDEYDHFANELLSFQVDLFQESVSKTGFVRKWYEVLKKFSKTSIARIFATGVSPITLDSLTSGFNIADNITRNEAFHEMMGFTEDEVKFIIQSTLKPVIDNNTMTDLLDILKKNYNGYMFSEDANIKLFNSDMILYFLKTYVSNNRGPNDLVDENIAGDYGKLGKMFELRDKNANFAVLEKILNGEEVIGQITKQFSMDKEFSSDDFKSLLFYLGLLTIDEKILDSVKLKTPNYVIKSLYYQYYAKKINEHLGYEIDISHIKEGIRQVALEGKNSQLVTVVENTLHKLSDRDYIKFDEKYVKLLIMSYCMLSNVYLVKSEYEVEDGYIDIALLRREPVQPAYFAIFEIKYIKKSEFKATGEPGAIQINGDIILKNAIVAQKKAEALQQLAKYTSSSELKSIPNLKKWVLIFAGDKCVVNEELIGTSYNEA